MATVRKEVLLDQQHIDDFERFFPNGSLSWALSMLLERFVSQYKQTPAEYAEIAAREFKEEIT